MNARQAAQAILAIADALLDTVRATGANGAPAGPLYAASMGVLSLAHFEAIMGALVQSGKVRKSGHVYYIV